MPRRLIALALICALAPGLATAQSPHRPSQLERLTVSPDEYGLYDPHTLFLIKTIQDNPRLNSSEVRRQVGLVKRGIIGRFRIDARPPRR